MYEYASLQLAHTGDYSFFFYMHASIAVHASTFYKHASITIAHAPTFYKHASIAIAHRQLQ